MRNIKKIFAFMLSVVIAVCALPSCVLTASAESMNWVGSWGTPAIESGVVVGSDSVFSQNGIHLRDYIPANSTVRTTVVPTIGGSKIRLKFSNVFGKEAITINETTVAKTGSHDDEVVTDTITKVTFNGGHSQVNIAAGSEIYSDEISFNTTAMEKISISSYFRNSTPMYVVGLYGGTSYLGVSLGNRTHKETLTSVASKLTFTSNTITYYTIPFLTRVDVYSPNSYCVVLFGDSTLTNDAYLLLEQKLRANGINNVGVIMSGIIGNSLLHDGVGLLGKVYGESALKRANRDAFDIPGVKSVIVKVGENDILHPMEESMKGIAPYVSPAQVIQGYRDLSNMARNKGIAMYLCTRTPYKGYERNFVGTKDLTWTQHGENLLLEINSWVKYASDGYYKAPINLDAMRDPSDSTKLRSQMTTDGIHFSHLGQIAFVDLIPEDAYGVNKNLKDLSVVLKIDPYTAPKPNNNSNTQNNNNQNNNNQNSNQNNNNGNNSQNNSQTPVTQPNIVVGTTAPVASNTNQELPSVDSANQILVNGNNNDNNQTNMPIGSIDDSNDSSTRQMIGFAILAAVAAAIIAIAAVMLVKMSPSAGGPVTRDSISKRRKKSGV